MSFTRQTACGTQSIIGLLTGQDNIDCPVGMLPERDPATGDWARDPVRGCFVCSTVQVLKTTPIGQPYVTNWGGTQSGGILPTAANYYAPTVKSWFDPATPGGANTLLTLAAVAVGGVFLLSLLRR